MYIYIMYIYIWLWDMGSKPWYPRYTKVAEPKTLPLSFRKLRTGTQKNSKQNPDRTAQTVWAP